MDSGLRRNEIEGVLQLGPICNAVGRVGAGCWVRGSRRAGVAGWTGLRDTPGRAAVDPAGGSGVVRADVPAAPRFDALAQGTGRRAADGWVPVSAQGQVA